MPFAFIVIGLMIVISAARGTHRELGALLKGDFTGSGNFVYWLAAIGIVGTVGYIQKAQTLSRAFLSLILIAMILSNRGFFEKLQQAIEQLGSSSSTGSGAAGNTLDNAQAAPQTPGAGSGGGTDFIGDLSSGNVGAAIGGAIGGSTGRYIGGFTGRSGLAGGLFGGF